MTTGLNRTSAFPTVHAPIHGGANRTEIGNGECQCLRRTVHVIGNGSERANSLWGDAPSRGRIGQWASAHLEQQQKHYDAVLQRSALLPPQVSPSCAASQRTGLCADRATPCGVCTRRRLGRAQTAIKRHARLSRDRFESVENPCKVGSLLRLESPAFTHQGGEGRRVVRRVGGQFGPWE